MSPLVRAQRMQARAAVQWAGFVSSVQEFDFLIELIAVAPSRPSASVLRGMMRNADALADLEYDLSGDTIVASALVGRWLKRLEAKGFTTTAVRKWSIDWA